MSKPQAPAKSLEITTDVTVRFDVEAYALSYGFEGEQQVREDALTHLTAVATEAVREAVERLGIGVTDVRLQGSRIYVAEYRA